MSLYGVRLRHGSQTTLQSSLIGLSGSDLLRYSCKENMFPRNIPRSGSLKLAKRREEFYEELHRPSSSQSHRQNKMETGRVNLSRRNSRSVVIYKDQNVGFGFSIRGGAEYGTGIFISQVNELSDAYNYGLSAGDQILKANDRTFLDIYHDAAVKFLNSKRRLKLLILSLGIIPGRIFEQTQYQWIDCYGYPTSPPENRLPPAITSSGRRLLNADDERKVNVVVGKGARLGLLIRGGSEYGLGIYVAGTDRNSVADKCGILVGEQILEVNGISFLQIPHAAAAQIIRTSKMMTIVLKDVGKVPLSKTVYDHTEWVDGRRVRRGHPYSSRSYPQPKRSPVFHPNIAGSQMRHESVVVGPSTYGLLEDHSKVVLSPKEQATFQYYIREYSAERLPIHALVLSLLDLLNTNEKLGLLADVRSIIRPHDIDQFDNMVLKRELKARRSRNSPRRADIPSSHASVNGYSYTGASEGTPVPTSILRHTAVRETVDRVDLGQVSPIAGPSSDSNFSFSPRATGDFDVAEHLSPADGLALTPNLNALRKKKSPSHVSFAMDQDATDTDNFDDSEEPIYAKPLKKKKGKFSVIKLKNVDMDELREMYGYDGEENNEKSNDVVPIENGSTQNIRIEPEVEVMKEISWEEEQRLIEADYDDADYAIPIFFNGHTDEGLSNGHTGEAFENGYATPQAFVGTHNQIDLSQMKSSVIHGRADNGENASDDSSDQFSSPRESIDVSVTDDNQTDIGLSYAFQFLRDEPLDLGETSLESAENGGSTETDQDLTDSDSNHTEDKSVDDRRNSFGQSLFKRTPSSANFSNGSSLDNYRPSATRYGAEMSSEAYVRSRRQMNHIVDLDDASVTEKPPDLARLTMNDEQQNRPSERHSDPLVDDPFNTDPSIDRRYSNFSVNDILRQEYLPTSSSDFDSFVPRENLNASVSSENRLLSPEPLQRNRKGKLGSLKIQDQYEYERSLKRSGHQSPPIDDPTYSHYAKPVVVRSPRPDFNPGSSQQQSSNPLLRVASTELVAPIDSPRKEVGIKIKLDPPGTPSKRPENISSTPSKRHILPPGTPVKVNNQSPGSPVNRLKHASSSPVKSWVVPRDDSSLTSRDDSPRAAHHDPPIVSGDMSSNDDPILHKLRERQEKRRTSPQTSDTSVAAQPREKTLDKNGSEDAENVQTTKSAGSILDRIRVFDTTR